MQWRTQAAAARRVLEATLTTAKRLQSIRKDAAVFADVLQEMVRTQLDSLTPGATTVVPAGWAYEKGSPHICAVLPLAAFHRRLRPRPLYARNCCTCSHMQKKAAR
jgi:hypothetical protein